MEYINRGASVCQQQFDENTTYCNKFLGNQNEYLNCVDEAKEIRHLCEHREKLESKNYY